MKKLKEYFFRYGGVSLGFHVNDLPVADNLNCGSRLIFTDFETKELARIVHPYLRSGVLNRCEYGIGETMNILIGNNDKNAALFVLIKEMPEDRPPLYHLKARSMCPDMETRNFDMVSHTLEQALKGAYPNALNHLSPVYNG